MTSERLDAARAVLADLARLGIDVSACDGRLRLRPQSALTPELLARAKSHKAGLLALLADKGHNQPSRPSRGGLSDAAAQPPADGRADVLAVVRAVQRFFPGAELVGMQPADERHKPHVAAWPAAELVAGLSPRIAGLVQPRDGWTPAAWRDYLTTKAARCEPLHPDQAAEFRRAAVVLSPSLWGAYKSRVVELETGGRSADEARALAAAGALELLSDVQGGRQG